MIISTQTDVLSRRFGYEKAIRTVAASGFDAFDFSFFEMSDDGNVFNTDAYLDEAKRLRAIADSIGIRCNQAHAPFPSLVQNDTEAHIAFNQTINEKIRRSMEAASILGAEAIVIHPIHHVHYLNHREELIDRNIDFYTNVILPYCKKYKIRAAVENMWQRSSYDNKIIPSVASEPDDFCRLYDALDPAWFVCCLDIGHAALIGYRPEILIRALGGKRLHALHMHDVDGRNDLHTLPGISKIDWGCVVDALAEIGYDGEFTLEADNFLRGLPDDCLEEGSRFMATVIRSLANRFDKKVAELANNG